MSPGSVLESIRRRGKIRAGVSLGFHGLSWYDEEKAEWAGFDVDVARAVAVALLGDPGAVEFVPLTSAERFEALDAGRIDLGSYNSSITLSREARHDAAFVHPILFDGEVFATHRVNLPGSTGPGSTGPGSTGPGAASPSEAAPGFLISDAKTLSVAMLAGSTTADNVAQYLGSRGIAYTPRPYATPQEALAGYLSGEASVYCLDSYLLAGELSHSANLDDHVFLRDQVSLEAMSPAVPASDPQFVKAVRWTLFAIIEADNLGIGQDCLPIEDESRLTPYLRTFLHPPAPSAENLGLLPDFTSRVIAQVGSYADIFERNLGMRSALRQERRANHLRVHGGMLYAPLFI